MSNTTTASTTRPFLAFALVASVCVLAGAIVASGPTPACADDGAAKQYVLGVEGMSCPVGCAPKVHESLAAVDGVDSVEVSFESKQAVVHMAPGKTLTQEACDEAFGNSGYFVSTFAEKDARPATPNGG